MYKLFLTFRYLTRKAIVIFPILVVWLCVMMLIIVTSIMGGFVDRVREANRDLYGDIVVEAASPIGWGHYQEFQKQIAELKWPDGTPVVVASTPVVRAYGLVNLPERYNSPAIINGIDPAGRAAVSGFEHTLYREYQAPMHAAEVLSAELPATGEALRRAALAQETAAEQAFGAASEQMFDTRAATPLTQGQRISLTAEEVGVWAGVWVAGAALVVLLVRKRGRRRRLGITLGVLLVVPGLPAGGLYGLSAWRHTGQYERAQFARDQVAQLTIEQQQARRTLDFARGLAPQQQYSTLAQLQKAFLPPVPTFTPPPAATEPYARTAAPPTQGIMLGVDLAANLGLTQRDSRGNYSRPLDNEYPRAVVTVVPLQAGGALGTGGRSQSFIVVDDSYTRVIDVDQMSAYAPFATVQKLLMMQGYTDADTGEVFTPRTHELQIRVSKDSDPARIQAANAMVNSALEQLAERYPDLRPLMLQARTWDQKQATYISAVENEKNMLTFILLLMSGVVLVVIFLIFYMIVRDKTRDIGIIKAIGGSELGVVQIFLQYGLFIGIVGGLLGLASGVEFVWHTNEIHEWIYRTTGVMIWNRSVYLFDRIPDTIHPPEVALYVVLAIAAGAIGALIPALIAGLQDPVKAVRYE